MGWANVANIRGPVGATGASGSPGAMGATGASGSPGAVGATGASGSPGAVGATGATGASGSPGAVGATGASGPAGSPRPNVGATGSSATPAINVGSVDQFNITALATAITSMSSGLSGSPVDGQKLLIRIKDNGTARTIAWGASFISSGVAVLPTTTVVNKTHLVGFIYDSAMSDWVCVAVDAAGY